MVNSYFSRILVVIALMLSSAGSVIVVAQGIPERVQFKRGTHSCTVTGRVKGDRYKDFIMRARAGETMKLKLNSDNAASSFVLYSINGRPTGNAETQEWNGILPENGEYVVRVFMSRAEARRPEAASDFSLYIFITLLKSAKLPPDFVYSPTVDVAQRQIWAENPV